MSFGSLEKKSSGDSRNVFLCSELLSSEIVTCHQDFTGFARFFFNQRANQKV